MRLIAFCSCVLLLVGCDTLGGRAVVLKLQPAAKESEVQQVLQVLDRTLPEEGASRVAPSSGDEHRIAYYIGGGFSCTVLQGDDELIVDFRNPGVTSSSRPTPKVRQVSAAVAEDLKVMYGDRRVRFEK